MAVFSSVLSDAEILNKVDHAQAKYIHLIVCGGCANESLAYTNNLPIFTSREGENLEQSIAHNRSIPYAAQITAEQIAELLRNQGYTVTICVVPLGEELLCIQNKASSVSLSSAEKADLILALCCPAGAVGIRQQIKNIPVVTLMEPQGQLFYVYQDDLFSRWIVAEESAVIR